MITGKIKDAHKRWPIKFNFYFHHRWEKDDEWGYKHLKKGRYEIGVHYGWHTNAVKVNGKQGKTHQLVFNLLIIWVMVTLTLNNRYNFTFKI